MTKNIITAFTFLLLLILNACRSVAGSPTPSPSEPFTEVPLATATSTIPPSPLPSATPIRSQAILLAPLETAPWLVESLEEILPELTRGAATEWQVLPAISPPTLTDEISLVVALPPYPDLQSLAAGAPKTRFLAIGFPGLQPAPNLSVLGPDGLRPDQQAFVAGYLATVITPDWRVGVMYSGDSEFGRAAQVGFVNGGQFFCGLCLPVLPPYLDYPLFVEIPPGADPAVWQTAADQLLASEVKTIYLDPAVDQEALRTYLVEKEVNLVGGTPRGQTPRDHWVATVRPDIRGALEESWPAFISGDGGTSAPVPLALDEVNATLLSPGRQRLVEALLLELSSGLVDTGVDPLTGEVR